MYKTKKRFSAKIWYPYYYATITNRQADTPQLAAIKLGCTRTAHHSSEHTYTDGTVQTTKVKGILVKLSITKYNDNLISPTIYQTLKTKNNCFLGANGYMDLTKTRILTNLKVECYSYIDSELLKPHIYLEKSITSPTSSANYETTVDAYRSNPGGFVGFNFAVAKSDVTKLKDLKGKYHLFPEESYRHSELNYEENLNIKLEINNDLILIPNFNWLKAINATYILANGKQAMTVSRPYYEFNVIATYYEL